MYVCKSLSVCVFKSEKGDEQDTVPPPPSGMLQDDGEPVARMTRSER